MEDHPPPPRRTCPRTRSRGRPGGGRAIRVHRRAGARAQTSAETPRRAPWGVTVPRASPGARRGLMSAHARSGDSRRGRPFPPRAPIARPGAASPMSLPRASRFENPAVSISTQPSEPRASHAGRVRHARAPSNTSRASPAAPGARDSARSPGRSATRDTTPSPAFATCSTRSRDPRLASCGAARTLLARNFSTRSHVRWGDICPRQSRRSRRPRPRTRRRAKNQSVVTAESPPGTARSARRHAARIGMRYAGTANGARRTAPPPSARSSAGRRARARPAEARSRGSESAPPARARRGRRSTGRRRDRRARARHHRLGGRARGARAVEARTGPRAVAARARSSPARSGASQAAARELAAAMRVPSSATTGLCASAHER